MPTVDEPVVTLLPSGKQFPNLPHHSVLEAGLSAGVSLPYRCSNGSCGECRARIVNGRVEVLRFYDYTLTGVEKSAGVILLCSHRALTALEIEVSEASHAEDIPQQQLTTRVCHTETSDDVLIVRFKISRGKALWYLAGQYATLHIPGAEPSVLPIATCPCEAGYLEFHLSAGHSALQNTIVNLPRRERIQVTGPQGNFTINDTTINQFHHVFIAVDTHFATVKPMIEHLMATELEPRCTLIWVATNHYRNNLCRSWSDAFEWFSYTALSTSRALVEEIEMRQRESQLPVRAYLSAPDSIQRQLHSQLTGVDVTPDQTTVA